MKRSLDIFSHFCPQNKKIRIGHKLNLEHGAIASKAAPQPHSNSKPSAPENPQKKGVPKNELVVGPSLQPKDGFSSERERNLSTAAIMERIPSKWHPPSPWKNYRVISGHLGWVQSVAVDHNNSWFCTGSADRTIKIWDLATGTLKLTLTGHIQQIRGLALSNKKQTHIFSAGHDNTISSVFTPPLDPQVITASHDSTIKFWDLRYANTTLATLTHHKKSVRAMALHPKEDNAFASASADNIKKFNLPRGEFLQGVMATGGDNGSLWFWDWRSGHNFQQAQTIVQPGSLESEAAIYALTYDVTGTKLITCEADKTIKMWKEDGNATPETHHLHFNK
nr:protein pleiotropic regulatory locus 1-like [Ipomoea batatas]